MSHLKTTVAGKAPNSLGEITVTPEDLSDVTVTSVQPGEVLTYDGSVWKNVSGGGDDITFCFIGDGEQDIYNGTPASYDVTGIAVPFPLEIYATNPVVTGKWTPTFTTKTRTGGDPVNANWIQSFTLPAGIYHLRASIPGTFTSTAAGKSSRISWYQDNAQIGTATMYTSLLKFSMNGYTTAIVTSTGSEVYSVQCVWANGLVTIQSDHSFIEIMKLGMP